MTMEFLYGEMKAALKFFELSFHDMAEVEVSIVKSSVVFRHNGRELHITLDAV